MVVEVVNTVVSAHTELDQRPSGHDVLDTERPDPMRLVSREPNPLLDDTGNPHDVTPAPLLVDPLPLRLNLEPIRALAEDLTLVTGDVVDAVEGRVSVSVGWDEATGRGGGGCVDRDAVGLDPRCELAGQLTGGRAFPPGGHVQGQVGPGEISEGGHRGQRERLDAPGQGKDGELWHNERRRPGGRRRGGIVSGFVGLSSCGSSYVCESWLWVEEWVLGLGLAQKIGDRLARGPGVAYFLL